MRGGVAVALLSSAILPFLACGCSEAEADRIPAELVIRRNPVPLTEAGLGAARKTYDQICRECHGTSGKGDGPMSGMYKEKPPDLTNEKALEVMTDGEIYWLITKGQKPMPASEGKLNEEERWNLVHLMRAMSNTKPNSTTRE
jgi:mono/diheme cytochrome c family protein